MAKCLGVSKRTIIGWERDGRYPRNVEILEKMADIFHVPLTYIQPDQSLFIERAAATYGKKGKIEAQHLAFELTELFASGELTAQDMDGIMYEMHKAYFKYREQEREKNRILTLSLSTILSSIIFRLLISYMFAATLFSSRTFSPNFMFATFLWSSYRTVTMCNGICKYSIQNVQ